MPFRLLICVVFALAAPIVAVAQNPIVGVWERISWVTSDGRTLQPPAFPSFTIFTADGFWSQMIIPPGRTKIDKPVEQLSREELVERFGKIEARYGIYSISGDRLTSIQKSNANPNLEGSVINQIVRMDGEILVLRNPQNGNVARFRRVKKE